MMVVDSVEALQDRASVTGKVVFHTLYTQGDPTKVNAIEATADFTHIMELPGAQPRNQCRVEAQVEHAEAAAQGGRLSLRCGASAGRWRCSRWRQSRVSMAWRAWKAAPGRRR